MPKFSEISLLNLNQATGQLQELFQAVIERFDCRIICGYRDREAQERAFEEGRTTKHFPNSKHNVQPSLAVDVVPWPLDWKDLERFKQMGYFVLGVAHGLGIKVRWGADWNMNLKYSDETFLDWPHFEVVSSVSGKKR